MARTRDTAFGFSFRVERAGVVGLTLVDVRDIQKGVEREGREPRETKKDRSADDADTRAHLPTPELTLEDVDQLLAAASPSSPLEALSSFRTLVDALHRQRLLPGLQAYLDRVHEEVGERPGGNFGSFEANRAFAETLRIALDRVGARLECPKCCQAATLIVRPAGTKTGAFQFHHARGNQNTDHLGSTSLPKLKLLPEP